MYTQPNCDCDVGYWQGRCVCCGVREQVITNNTWCERAWIWVVNACHRIVPGNRSGTTRAGSTTDAKPRAGSRSTPIV